LPTFTVSGAKKGGIILETIKTAEDSDAIVLRLYEALGGRGKGNLEMWDWPYIDKSILANPEQ
jgi:alpha-mannosidase